MRYISLSEVLELHRRIIEESGGSMGLRDLGGLESAIAQPRMTFGGRDLYPTLVEKAAALCFSLVQNFNGRERPGNRSPCGDRLFGREVVVYSFILLSVRMRAMMVSAVSFIAASNSKRFSTLTSVP